MILLAMDLAIAGEQSVEGVLQRVSDVYSRIEQYTIRVKTREVGELGGAAVVRSVPDNLILLVRSGQMFRYEYRTPVSEGVWLTDGVTEWHWRRDLEEYIEQAASLRRQEGPGNGLQGVEWAYFAKFRTIHTAVGSAKLLKTDVRRDNDCPEPAVLVEIALGQSPLRESEKLWIGVRTSRVYRSVLTRSGVYRGTAQRLERRTVWNYEAIDERIDPALFQFRPPKGSERVTSFTEPRLAHPVR
jgi:hypothetical protein